MATITITPGQTFASGDTVTSTKLNNLGSPVASLSSATIVNADVSASAAIAHSKLATITAGSVLLGNASAVPTATALTGDVTVNSSGVTAIGAGVIVDADVSASAAIGLSKLATGALPTAITVASANLVDGTIVNADINASAAIDITKLGTSTTAALGVGSIELGHATDTTLSRAAAGRLAVEGVNVVTTSSTDTLTNKTLTAPVISSITNTGTLTLPTSTDTLVGRATTDTLTNKTIALGSNTVTGTKAQFDTAVTDDNFAYTGTANSFTASQTVTGTVTTQAASTQDAVVLQGRAGGTSSRSVTLTPASLTASRTLTLPDTTGTVVTTGDNGTVTSTMIANDTIVNADINSAAAISLSKLATGALPTAITVASANIVDGTIVDADISGTAAISLSKLATGALPTAITVASANIVDGTIATADIADSAVTPAKLSQKLTFATSQASTSGTSIDFTSIPSWVKRITILLDGVSTNGSSGICIQIGTSSGFVSSGYSGTSGIYTSTVQSVISVTNGFGWWAGASGDVGYGHAQIVNITGNSWVACHNGGIINGASYGVAGGGGSVALSGALDRVRITTVNGTDTFDAGTINISYEG